MSMTQSSAADHPVHEDEYKGVVISLKKQLSQIQQSNPGSVDPKEWEEMTTGFCSLYERYSRTKTNVVDWSAINPPSDDSVHLYSELAGVDTGNISEMAQKLVVIKLNGGLGTSMGCKGPKSVIEVRNHQTFLDLTVKQIEHLNNNHGSTVPLVLMNSFNTHSDTLKIVKKYENKGITIEQFNQSKYPRIEQETGFPLISDPVGTLDQWYPPGHGDIYSSLERSGLLDKFIADGKEWAFISNIDNLAAIVDWKILKHAIETQSDFIMEVTNKTRSDIKGGTLIKYGSTPLRLLEVAQVPKEHISDFTSIKKFKIFNTNNLWVNLKALKAVLSSTTKLDAVEIIPNPKVVNGIRILQLETAAGAAIGSFKKPLAINVPRSRFLPVKSCSDLFVVQSDLFAVNHGSLTMSKLRPFPSPPVVKLGPYFKLVSNYNARLGGKPNIIELDQLTISGDVSLGRGVVLKGTVIIVASEGNAIHIPNGSVLEDSVVTGSLRIVAH